MSKYDRWMEELPTDLSLDISRELAYSHARKGGKVGSAICRLIHANDLRMLCEFELPSYEDVDAWLDAKDDAEPEVAQCEALNEEHQNRLVARYILACRQALAFFQKLESLDLGIDKKKVAFLKFLEAEKLCKNTNELFRATRSGRASFMHPSVTPVLHTAKRKIATILGKVPTLRELGLRFGPGATRGVKRKDACSLAKLSETPSCSEELSSLAPYILEQLPHYVAIHEKETEFRLFESYYDEVATVDVQIQTSKLSFVPKNFKTYRSICVEPSLNTLFQAGIGDYMAKRLAKFGIDITDQSRNQELARQGSLTGALATLDLSSASDTVSLELCAELLPLDWFILLKRARSAEVSVTDPIIKGSYTLRQEKFSSMGNGFTFPLETLIFFCLSASAVDLAGYKVLPNTVSAYGDDIIVPTGAYELVTQILTACGFVVNLGKSYSKGSFRESCGADWYSGINVRPLYPKDWWSAQSLFVAHNHFVRRSDYKSAEEVLRYIPMGLRLWGPDGFGDGHLVGDYVKVVKPEHAARGYGGHVFSSYVLSADKVPLEGSSAHASVLYESYRKARRRKPGLFRKNLIVRPGLPGFAEALIETPLPIPTEDGKRVLATPGSEPTVKKKLIYVLGA